MLNTVILMGRLTADPELKTTASGKSVCSFCMAVNRSYGGKDNENKTDWIDIVAWRNTAEFVCKYFRKGQMMIVEGTLQTRTWEDQNGSKRKVVEVVASNVNFGEAKRDRTDADTRGDSPAPLPSADHYPQGYTGSALKPAPELAAPVADSNDFEQLDFSDDDLPF